jgi:hypothetical protein
VSVPSDEEAEKIIRSLQLRGYRVRAIVEHDARKRLATVCLALSYPDDVVVDPLFASSGIETEVAIAAEALEILPGFAAKGDGTLGTLCRFSDSRQARDRQIGTASL